MVELRVITEGNFMDRTVVLMKWIQSLSYEEQKNLTPALLAYDGIQYTYMALAVF
mgnify:CR=1 FL=1